MACPRRPRAREKDRRVDRVAKYARQLETEKPLKGGGPGVWDRNIGVANGGMESTEVCTTVLAVYAGGGKCAPIPNIRRSKSTKHPKGVNE